MKALLVLLFFFTTSVCYGHDLGVVKAEFSELEPASYRLRVKASGAAQKNLSAPKIPQKCTFSTPPQGRSGRSSLDFEFRCATPLVAGDQLDLPWQLEGIILRKGGGSTEKKQVFFPRQGESIPISLAQLQ